MTRIYYSDQIPQLRDTAAIEFLPTDHAAIPERIPTEPAVNVDFSTIDEREQIGAGGRPKGTLTAVLGAGAT